MGCFSGGTKGQSTTQQPKLTPEQTELVNALVAQTTPAIQGVTGATVPGNEFAPGGPSQLQQQAFQLGGQLPQQLAFDQNRVAGQFQPVADFANANFQQQTVPGLANAAGFGGTARSSGFSDALLREGANLNLGLAAQLGGQQFGAFQQSQQQAQQIPGQLAGLGGLQQSFPEAQRQFSLQQFQAGAPENDPRLAFINPALTSTFDTAVQQGFATQGVGSQALGAAGAGLGGYALAMGAV